MIERPEDGAVVFRRTGLPRRRLPFAIDQVTLGAMLILWSLASIADGAASMQLVFLTPAPPGHPWSLLQMLQMLQATPFPWLWYFVAAPSCLMAFALVVTAGAVLMVKRRRWGRRVAATGLVLAVGVDLVTLAVEVASLGVPFHMPWQWLVTTATSVVFATGAVYLVAAVRVPGSASGSAANLAADDQVITGQLNP